jgi:hypothetical protein
MANTGPKTCVTIESTGTWANFTTARLNVLDGSYASTAKATADSGKISDFVFGIPAGAVILGIEVKVTFGLGKELYVGLSYDNGVNWVTQPAQAAGAVSEKTFGGAADLWGHAWVPAEFAAGTFMVDIEGTAGISSLVVDYVTVTVYYSYGCFFPFFMD